MTDLIKRPLDEEFDTMMEVQRNPTGAWMAIQEQAARIEKLVKQQDALKEYIDRYSYTELSDEAKARCFAEAKLTKAVEALRHTLDKPRSADQTYAALFSEVMWEICFVLADLEVKE